MPRTDGAVAPLPTVRWVTSVPPPLLNETIRTIHVLLEIFGIASGVPDSMFRQEHGVRSLGPAWAGAFYVAPAEAPRQPVVVEGTADVFNKLTHSLLFLGIDLAQENLANLFERSYGPLQSALSADFAYFGT